ncbi:N,N-dimethylformamidase beta subunit family domain-containing protein [Lysobacter sp. ISL-50]|uniref:N,N-dimethylformamidase beta subunit family domain-containing protein n=2 Tax=Lysobacter TaxID=68 RepID=UPI0031BA1D5B
MNRVQQENQRPGHSDWPLTDPATAREIEGYASKTSYNRGEEVVFFVNMGNGAAPGTNCSAPGANCPRYTLEVFRMGWYAGAGARRVFGPQQLPGYAQPMPVLDASNPAYAEFGLIECQWQESYRLSTAFTTDADWVSGIYLARVTIVADGAQQPQAKQSYVVFAIRDDARASDYLFQQSVTTYQSYNNWPGALAGGKSSYGNSSPFPDANPTGESGIYARKISFDRPYGIRENPSYLDNGAPANAIVSGREAGKYGVGAGEFLTTLNHTHFTSGRGQEYNFVRFLEREGYDVTYATNVDVHRSASVLLNHRGFLSVGHDEYWSKSMRDHVEAARDAGVNLGFFSANTCFIQIRFEAGAGGADRVVVSYKSAADPCASSTTGDCPANATMPFRELPVPRPEHWLLGVAFRSHLDQPKGSAGTPTGNPTDYYSADFVVDDAGTWVTQDTGLQHSDHLRALMGYEVDSLPENIADRRPGIKTIGASQTHSIDNSTIAHTTTHDVASGATVFASGSIQWSWGVDNYNADPVVYPDANGVPFNTQLESEPAKQITRNVLERLRSRNRTDVFALGLDNGMYWRSRVGGVWQDWQGLGGGFLFAPAVTSKAANRLSLFAVGLDSHLYQNLWNGSAWLGWTHLGAPAGRTLTSNPAAISRDGVTTDVFARTSNGSDFEIWRLTHDGTSWGSWQSLGGGFKSGPAVSSWNSQEMTVFAIGLDDALWNNQWTAGTWSGWVSLGGPGQALVSTPAAVSRGDGKMDVFALGANKQIWQRSHDNGWQPWASRGGVAGQGPAVASWHANRLTLVAVDENKKPMVCEWDRGVWSSWTGQDGSLISAPAAVSWYGNE